MFAIFEGENFIGFWANSVGDVFIQNTIHNLALNPSTTKLLYYPSLPREKDYEFDQYTIKYGIRENYFEYDEDGNGTPASSFTEEGEIEPVTYYDGEIIIPC